MKDKIISLGFVSIIFLFVILNIFTPKKDISTSERRELAKFPVLSSKTIWNGEFMEKFEKYSLDHFVFRDSFRSLKAVVDLKVFGKLDNNGIYVIGENVFKMDYPLNEKSVIKFSNKLNELYDKHLSGMNVYYSIIPDKTSYDNSFHLKADYEYMKEIAEENIKEDIKYIDLFSVMELGDYYRTDLHWRQESLFKVLRVLDEKMNFGYKEGITYSENKHYPFYGAYYGQSALSIKPDEIVYLSSSVTESAVVTNLEGNGSTSVYYTEGLGGIDSYDVFMQGATPLITVRNKEAGNERRLIIFRDSFASSLAPLMLEYYDEITLVDIRYMSSTLLDEYIDFEDQDVLFLYNTQVVNNSDMLR